MALILKGAIKLYNYLNNDIAEVTTQNWPLMKSPWPGFAVLAIYLLTVLRWLPEYMKNRPPYDLRKIIALYNTIQIFFCSYVVYQSLKLGWLNEYKLVCQPVGDGPESIEYAWKVCYIYFVIKLIDLLDTVFFALRKKHNQVTFLHVYHHFGMVAVAWGMVKWVPGGHMTLLVPINSFVHIIMYTYYLLTVWDESYKKSLWWKKHVTQIQITQFTILLLHFLVLVIANDCSIPRQPAYILIPQNLFMVSDDGDRLYRYQCNFCSTPNSSMQTLLCCGLKGALAGEITRVTRPNILDLKATSSVVQCLYILTSTTLL